MIFGHHLEIVIVAIAGFSFTSASLFAQSEPSRGQNPRRQELERRFKERVGALVQRRLQLTPDQMTRLQATNRQFEQRRILLASQERDLPKELRSQLLLGDKADQNKVSQLLEQSFRIQRQRLDLAESEQRELAKFMTPVQRAKYFGLQNELRKRAQELRPRGVKRPPNRRGTLRPKAPRGM